MKNLTGEEMTLEIEKRLKSSNWDNFIASTVLEKQKKRKKVYALTAGFSSLATAAVFAIVMLFSIQTPTQTNTYSDLLSKQASGTYDSVFGSKNILSEDNFDTMIEDTLAMR